MVWVHGESPQVLRKEEIRIDCSMKVRGGIYSVWSISKKKGKKMFMYLLSDNLPTTNSRNYKFVVVDTERRE